MPEHDRLHQEQAEARGLPTQRARRVVGLERVRQRPVAQCRARAVAAQAHSTRHRGDRELRRRAGGGELVGDGDQSRQRRGELTAIAEHRQFAVAEADCGARRRRLHRTGGHRWSGRGFGGEFAQVEAGTRPGTVRRLGQQPQALDRRLDADEARHRRRQLVALVARFGRLQRGAQQLQVARDELQRVVDLVGDAVGEVDERIGARPVAAEQRLLDRRRQLAGAVRMHDEPRLQPLRHRRQRQFVGRVGDHDGAERRPQLLQQAQRPDRLARVVFRQRQHHHVRLHARESVAVGDEVAERANVRPRRQVAQFGEQGVAQRSDGGNSQRPIHVCEGLKSGGVP